MFRPNFGRAKIPREVAAPELWENVAKRAFHYSLAGLVFGGICVLGGVVLFLNGIAGTMTWSAKLLGSESNLSNAAPGPILFVVGLIVIIVTRYRGPLTSR